jgi:multiple sugar transport system permease protein
MSIHTRTHIRYSKVDIAYSWLFLLPVIIILFIAALIPLLSGLYLSFHEYKLNMPSIPMRFVGVGNYIELFKDELFLQSLRNNTIFAFMSVSIEMVLGVLFAMLLSEDNKLSRGMITIVLIPMVIAPVAAGTLWRMMLDRTYGVINYLLSFIGISPISWLGDPAVAIYTIVAVDIWQFTPYVTILVLSSIKAIPRSFFESARVDGSSSWTLFRRIILPLSSPVIIVVMMLRFIDAFKVFDTIFVMTQGGPGNATEMLPTYIYQQGIKFFRVGYSSAIAVLFVITMSLVSWGYNKLRALELRRLD